MKKNQSIKMFSGLKAVGTLSYWIVRCSKRKIPTHYDIGINGRVLEKINTICLSYYVLFWIILKYQYIIKVLEFFRKYEYL